MCWGLGGLGGGTAGAGLNFLLYWTKTKKTFSLGHSHTLFDLWQQLCSLHTYSFAPHDQQADEEQQDDSKGYDAQVD